MDYLLLVALLLIFGAILFIAIRQNQSIYLAIFLSPFIVLTAFTFICAFIIFLVGRVPVLFMMLVRNYRSLKLSSPAKYPGKTTI